MKKVYPSIEALETRLSKFLFWYRLTSHSTTGIVPAQLLFGRIPRSHLDLLKPELSDKVRERQQSQKNYHDRHSKPRSFEVDDPVFVAKGFPHWKGVVDRYGVRGEGTSNVSRNTFGWKNCTSSR